MNRPFRLLLSSLLVSLLLLVVMILFLAPTAQAGAGATITVNSTVDDNTTNGNCTLREAIIAANTDSQIDACTAGNGADTIIVLTGTYLLGIPGINEDASAQGDLDIVDDLTIIGEGSEDTLIDGGQLDRVLHVDPSSLGGIEVSLSGLTIQGGEVEGPLTHGVGIWNQGNLTVTNSVIRNNAAIIFDCFNPDGGGGRGGGIFNEGKAIIRYSVIHENTACTGSGIYNTSIMYLHGVSVTLNLAGINGGGIDNDGILTMTQSVIADNRAYEIGGMLNRNQGKMTVTESVVSGNDSMHDVGGISNGGEMTLMGSQVLANSSNGAFAGIANQGKLMVSTTVIMSNTVTSFTGGCGGASNLHDGEMTVVASSIIGNATGPFNGNGGGICNSGTITVTNSTISNNSASDHGGGLWNGGPATINNTTITGNTADQNGNGFGDGGGIRNSGGALLTIANSIIAKNLDLSETDIRPDCADGGGDPITSNGHNLIGEIDGCQLIAAAGDIAGTITSPLDPMLDALAFNGGPTLSHALLPGSPAIDGGNPAAPGTGGNACEVTDQRGVSRPQGAACDIGAFEFVPGPTTAVVLDIQPGNESNSIVCTDPNAIIEVAILTTESFDAMSVDHTSVVFEGAAETHLDRRSGELLRHVRDVDADNDLDLLFHFRLDETSLTCLSDAGTLTGDTFSGQAIEGSDSILMIEGRR